MNTIPASSSFALTRLRFWCLAFCFLLAPSVGAAEQEQAPSLISVNGSISDPTGAPIPGAVVEIRSLDGSLAFAARTGFRGDFMVKLPAGDYTLSIHHPGFLPLANRFFAVREAMASLDLALEVAAPAEQIVVTATRTGAPLAQVGSSVTVITADDLARQGAANVAEALRRVAGLSLVQSGGPGQITSLFTRGGESDYTKVLIDGIPVNEPGGSFNFAGLSTAGIERIEVVRGPQSALFGSDAIAGVVQIITRRGESEGLNPAPGIVIEGGSFSTFGWGGSVTGRNDRLDYAASFSRRDTDNQVRNGSFNDAAGTLNLGVRFSRSTELRAVFRSQAGRAGTPGQHAFHRSDPDEYFRYRNLAGGLSLTLLASPSWTHRFSYSINDSRQFSEDPSDSGMFVSRFEGRVAPFPSFDFVYQTLNRTRRQQVQYQGELHLQRGHTLTAGADYERQSGLIGDPSFDPTEATRDNAGAFLQHQWSFGSRLFTAAGVRVEHNESFGYYAAPRFSAAVHLRQPSPGGFWGLSKLKAGFGTGIKEPTLVESFSNSPFFRGNPDLKAERSISFEAGFEQRFADGSGSLEVTWFDNRFRDQIGYAVTDFTTFEGSFFNMGKTRARGFETILRTALPAGFKLGGAYTFTDSKVLASTSAFDPAFAPGQPLFRRPRHAGHADLYWQSKAWRIGATAMLVGSRVDSDFSGLGMMRSPGYGVLNLLVSLRLSESSALFAAADNILDRKYMEVLGYPALGARFRVGLRTGF